MHIHNTKIYGRTRLMNKMNSYVLDREMPENVAILGVKGAGKTTFINRVFNDEMKTKYYREANIVVSRVSIPSASDNMKSFYSYIRESVFDGIEIVERLDPARYEVLMRCIEKRKQQIQSRSMEIDDAALESYLRAVIDQIQDDGMKLLLVFDDFESFADTSNLKNDQYKYMRDLANTGKISLVISTGQDLTKVSDEMKGSGFENIFVYEELRGIREQDIEDWIFDVADERNLEFEDDLLEWIEEVSGGIPEMVRMAIDIGLDLTEAGVAFDVTSYNDNLYERVKPLMRIWWQYTDTAEHRILDEVIQHASVPSNARNCLIKKGYLRENDTGKAMFVTPLFERYASEQIQEEGESKASTVQWRDHQKAVDFFQELVGDIVGAAMDEKFEKWLPMIQGMPERDEFSGEDGEIDFDRYKEAVADYISGKLAEPREEEICQAWNITLEDWNSFSAIRRNDCAMAYQLSTYVFSKDIDEVDYTPVIVMLGNFLEGILNDLILETLKQSMPLVSVRKKNNQNVALSNYDESMTIGGFVYIFKSPNAGTALSGMRKKDVPNLSQQQISTFAQKLSFCHERRNRADHPGNKTTHKDKNKFIKNMFLGQDSMLNIMIHMRNLI